MADLLNKLSAEIIQSPLFKCSDDKGSLPDFFNFSELKWQIYTTNHFYFHSDEAANRFFTAIVKALRKAKEYSANLNEEIAVDHLGGATVIIYYGRRS